MVVRRVVGVVWLLLLVVGLALALRARWAGVRDELATLDAVWLTVAGICGLAGVGASAGIWHHMLGGVGARLPLRPSLRIFFVGQVGKYLPGAVWPAVTQAALAREHGIAPRASVSAATLFLWVHLTTGCVVAVTALVATGLLPAPALAAVPVLVVLLVPAVLGWSLQTLLRLLRRRPLTDVPGRRAVAWAVVWAAVMWSLYGAHLHALTAAVGDATAPVMASGVFAASWVIGFVLLIAPAGVGPREAAIVALLPLGAAPALLVALVSRLALTIADAAWAAGTAADPVAWRGRDAHARAPVDS